MRTADLEGRILRNSAPSPDPIPPGCTEPCWLWTARRHNNGYAVMNVRVAGRHRKVYAHRVSYEHFKGPIPDGMEVDHLCRHITCVNPAHLEAVSPQENKRRRDQARRAA